MQTRTWVQAAVARPFPGVRRRLSGADPRKRASFATFTRMSGSVDGASEHAAARARIRAPEVLAPAGDESALRAALAAGSDAVYFGLCEGFNARARAGNFSLATLADTVAQIHRAGARAYLALNTLLFEGELEFVERVVRRAAETGVDALIVQDPALALVARAVCPALEVHASTQMTISSPEGARFAESLGVTRVVVPRELSVAEIEAFARGTSLELEVFIHGALCVAWSGQCLTSATWSGRSANRGQCAQSCRLPYDLVVDGKTRELGDVKYLLSPKDLAGVRAVADLARIGVHGLKIEGRQKNAQYVLTATETYRRMVDALADGHAVAGTGRDVLRASLSYTRGFSDGFLGGSDHQTLVEGRFPKHRGVYLGRVARVVANTVVVERDPLGRPWTGALAADNTRSAPSGEPSAALSGFGGASDASSGPRADSIELRAGMGVVFDAGDPEDTTEPGGPIFRVDANPRGWTLAFGTPGPDLERVAPGQRVWASGDPALARETERAVGAAEPAGRVRVVKINSDDNPGLSQAFQVRSIPYVAALVGGRVVAVAVDADLRLVGRLLQAQVPRDPLALLVPQDLVGAKRVLVDARPGHVLVLEDVRSLPLGDRAVAEARQPPHALGHLCAAAGRADDRLARGFRLWSVRAVRHSIAAPHRPERCAGRAPVRAAQGRRHPAPVARRHACRGRAVPLPDPQGRRAQPDVGPLAAALSSRVGLLRPSEARLAGVRLVARLMRRSQTVMAAPRDRDSGLEEIRRPSRPACARAVVDGASDGKVKNLSPTSARGGRCLTMGSGLVQT